MPSKRQLRPLCYPRLKARIAERDLTGRDLAEIVGIHQGTLSQILRGRLEPSAKLKERLAEAVGSEVADVFTTPERAA